MAEATAQQDAGESDDGAVADIAEHHAEHQHEGDGEQHGGIDLAVARHAVVQHQTGERLQPAVVADRRGHPQAFVGARIARMQRVAVAEVLRQHLSSAAATASLGTQPLTVARLPRPRISAASSA